MEIHAEGTNEKAATGKQIFIPIGLLYDNRFTKAAECECSSEDIKAVQKGLRKYATKHNELRTEF